MFYLFNLGNLLQLPEEYDVREHYKNYHCISFDDIRNQKSCGGCWAFSTAEVISDRYCIHSKGESQILFSEMELITCCKTLDNDPLAGCNGGYEYDGFRYWVTIGLPQSNCKKFLFEQGGDVVYYSDKLKCRETCDNGDFIQRYKGFSYSHISGEENIKREIYYNGPVTAAFYTYKSFNNYWINILPVNPNEIYENNDYFMKSSHSIKIIGWGIDQKSNKKYWLCVNSWGKDALHTGVFRFIRGINNCGIESYVNAGYFLDRIIDTNTEAYIVSRNKFFNFKNLTEDF